MLQCSHQLVTPSWCHHRPKTHTIFQGYNIPYFQVFQFLNFNETEIATFLPRVIRQITYLPIYSSNTQRRIPQCKGPLEPLPLVWWQDKTNTSSINRSQHDLFCCREFYLMCVLTSKLQIIFVRTCMYHQLNATKCAQSNILVHIYFLIAY